MSHPQENPVLDAAVIRRFWDKVDRRGPDECWPWTASKTCGGYSQMRIRGRLHYAHRIAVVIDGRDPTGKVVCHSCDFPPCVNPRHLRVGSFAENSQEAVRKGRSSRGEVNGRARLCDEDVRQIRLAAASGQAQVDLAGAFGVSGPTISFIVNRRTWRHLD